MPTVTRKWYHFNGASGGQQNQANYFLVSDFPNACLVVGSDICAVLGVYSITGNPNPNDDITYDPNPRSFAADTILASYINDALAAGSRRPMGPGVKAYVYVQ